MTFWSKTFSFSHLFSLLIELSSSFFSLAAESNAGCHYIGRDGSYELVSHKVDLASSSPPGRMALSWRGIRTMDLLSLSLHIGTLGAVMILFLKSASEVFSGFSHDVPFSWWGAFEILVESCEGEVYGICPPVEGFLLHGLPPPSEFTSPFPPQQHAVLKKATS